MADPKRPTVEELRERIKVLFPPERRDLLDDLWNEDAADARVWPLPSITMRQARAIYDALSSPASAVEHEHVCHEPDFAPWEDDVCLACQSGVPKASATPAASTVDVEALCDWIAAHSPDNISQTFELIRTYLSQPRRER